MSKNNSWMRKRLRDAEAPRNRLATDALSQLRKSRQPSEYAALVSALRIAAPKTSRALYAPGTRSPSELVWVRPTLQPLPLENELLWARHWLAGQENSVNRFRRVASQVQTLVLQERFGTAKEHLDIYVHTSGWSLWAVELRAALLQLGEGTNAQRAWLQELQATVRNSVPGLLFEVFGDRNDDTFSYEAVYTKCMNSFPRFESVAPWLVDYLHYRALTNFNDPQRALPNILSRDITSSLIDYYEGVVETLTLVEYDERLAGCRAAAAELLSTLLDSGYEDHRLAKILQAITGQFESTHAIEARPPEQFRTIYPGTPQSSGSHLPDQIESDLRQCHQSGAAAYEIVGKLAKWGLNFRGLDIGPAIALSALSATTNITDSRTLPLSIALLSDRFCIDDAAALSAGAARELLRSYSATHCNMTTEDPPLQPMSSSVEKVAPDPGPAHLWMAWQLLNEDNFDDLYALTNHLEIHGPYWKRQSARVRASALAKCGRLQEAIHLLEHWFRRDYRYAVEFPADTLFATRKWTHFKDLDPVEVGLVSHHEFEARASANVSYICKMACRAFLKTGMRNRVASDYDVAPKERKEQLIAFMREVWIEQNLAMCHQFATTTQVRQERMSALQLLLAWDTERAPDYAEGIKTLTFDQTLQQGLERIDQTRIFVNESAITRWAEKEIQQDYERWRKLSESTSGGNAIDDMLRQYILDPSNNEILRAFSNGKPTAADTLLIDIVDRLFKRFLLDPIDGLDTYLSLRIRHGSLRGTILGPLEEQGLLYSTTGFSREAFETRWQEILPIIGPERTTLLETLQEFSHDVRRIVDEFVDQRVQIQRAEKPAGAFSQTLSPLFAKVLAASLAERPPTFQAFLSSGYFVFWKLIELGLSDLRQQVSQFLATALHDRSEKLISTLRALGPRYVSLTTTLTTASTMTRSQCDTVAEWFRLPSIVAGERYELPDAIKIASAATMNVHRMFPDVVKVMSLPTTALPLTTSALAILMDCLFIIFENAWKHSGLAAELPSIDLFSEFNPDTRLLTLTARSGLSEERIKELVNGKLTFLREKYLGELPLDLVNLEGGSGFPKLARLARSVSRTACPSPFAFGIEERQWFTRITVALWEREGAFEAYE